MVKFINGNANDDYFDFLSSPDKLVITAGAGNDYVIGSRYADKIEGNLGNDGLKGSMGRDTIYGGSGNDEIFGGDGNMYNADPYADFIFAGTGRDTVYAGGGSDSVNGGDGNDIIYGDREYLMVPEWDRGTGADTINGGLGSDFISGGGGSDKLVGDSGNDTINGETGYNYLHGGEGNDILIFGSSKGDTLIGGYGSDRFMFDFDPYGLAVKPFFATIKDFTVYQDKLDMSELFYGNQYIRETDLSYNISTANVGGVNGTMFTVNHAFDGVLGRVFLENFTNVLQDGNHDNIFGGVI